MSDTPRTDEEVEIAKQYPATCHGLFISVDFARQLEHELSAAESKVDALQDWKQSQLSVEATWNPQDVAKALDLPLGSDIRKNILPAIKQLQAKVEKEELLRLVKEFRDAITNPLWISIGSIENVAEIRMDKAIWLDLVTRARALSRTREEQFFADAPSPPDAPIRGEQHNELPFAKTSVPERDPKEELIEKCVQVLLTAVMRQSCGLCCDNCNCQGVKYGVDAIRALQNKTEDSSVARSTNHPSIEGG